MTSITDKKEPRNKIVVADISHTVRTLVKNFLSNDYQVLEAATGSELLSILKEYHGCDSHCVDGVDGQSHLPERNASCDLKGLEMVIICMEFPDYHVYDLTEEIRKKYHKKCLPIILSTSNNRRDTIMAALERGINDVIVKPFPQELLISKIHKLERGIPVQDIKISELIATIPFFQGVPSSQVAYILNTCSKTLDKVKGDAICLEGDANHDLFILTEGRCEVLYHGRKVATIKPMETIGEMGFISENDRSATVLASEPSKVIAVNKELFDDYLNEERAISELICRNIILSLNDRIRKSNELVKKLKIMTEEYLSY